MNRVEHALADRRSRGTGAVMPFVCGGHPTPGVLARVLPALSDRGAAVIEVGIPFSDPIADGPVIAAAMHRALALGATPGSVVAEVRDARASTRAGVVAMVSISIVHRASPGAFIGMCAEAGIDGLIVPDLPLEESGELRGLAAGAGLIMPMLIAPTTPAERAERLARASTGFVYMLARAGITGERAELRSTELRARVGALRRVTDLPIACGFGISTPAQVAEVLRIADAAIVGSALVRRLDDAAAGGGDPVRAAGDFLAELTAAGPGR